MIYAYWGLVAVLIVLQLTRYISLPLWVFGALIAVPFAVWLVIVIGIIGLAWLAHR